MTIRAAEQCYEPGGETFSCLECQDGAMMVCAKGDKYADQTDCEDEVDSIGTVYGFAIMCSITLNI